jgi:Fur family transcriptional regulator, ferric uptake regulator
MIVTYRELKQAGIRPSASRVAVLSIFQNFPEDHLTADHVYRKLSPDGMCSLSSVYRALAQFTDAGLLISTTIGESRVVYELNRGGPHHHLVCTVCGCVVDIEASMAEQCAEVAARRHFTYSDANLVVFGRCAACQGKAT